MANGTIRVSPLKKQRGTCAVDGCECTAKHNDLCQLHYGRWHRKGSADWTPPTPRAELACAVRGCGLAVLSNGYCSLHFSRWRRMGDANWEPVKRARAEPKACKLDGCQRPVNALGLCKAHRLRQRRHGDPLRDGRKTPAKATALCEGCGEQFLTSKGARFCSDKCSGRFRAGWSNTAACEECGNTFGRDSVPFVGVCSETCRRAKDVRLTQQRVSRLKETLEYRERRRLAQQRRRVKIRSGKIESFSFVEIAERDEWVCSLCRQPVLRSLKWPHPFSPSLDHTVPVAAGGHHTRDNVTLAHLRCNMIKGDGRRMRLFG